MGRWFYKKVDNTYNKWKTSKKIRIRNMKSEDKWRKRSIQMSQRKWMT